LKSGSAQKRVESRGTRDTPERKKRIPAGGVKKLSPRKRDRGSDSGTKKGGRRAGVAVANQFSVERKVEPPPQSGEGVDFIPERLQIGA